MSFERYIALIVRLKRIRGIFWNFGTADVREANSAERGVGNLAELASFPGEPRFREFPRRDFSTDQPEKLGCLSGTARHTSGEEEDGDEVDAQIS